MFTFKDFQDYIEILAYYYPQKAVTSLIYIEYVKLFHKVGHEDAIRQFRDWDKTIYSQNTLSFCPKHEFRLLHNNPSAALRRYNLIKAFLTKEQLSQEQTEYIDSLKQWCLSNKLNYCLFYPPKKEKQQRPFGDEMFP